MAIIKIFPFIVQLALGLLADRRSGNDTDLVLVPWAGEVEYQVNDLSNLLDVSPAFNNVVEDSVDQCFCFLPLHRPSAQPVATRWLMLRLARALPVHQISVQMTEGENNTMVDAMVGHRIGREHFAQTEHPTFRTTDFSAWDRFSACGHPVEVDAGPNRTRVLHNLVFPCDPPMNGSWVALRLQSDRNKQGAVSVCEISVFTQAGCEAAADRHPGCPESEASTAGRPPALDSRPTAARDDVPSVVCPVLACVREAFCLPNASAARCLCPAGYQGDGFLDAFCHARHPPRGCGPPSDRGCVSTRLRRFVERLPGSPLPRREVLARLAALASSGDGRAAGKVPATSADIRVLVDVLETSVQVEDEDEEEAGARDALRSAVSVADALLSPGAGWRDLRPPNRSALASRLAGGVETLGASLAPLLASAWAVRTPAVAVEVLGPGRRRYRSLALPGGHVEVSASPALASGVAFASFRGLGDLLGGSPLSPVLAATTRDANSSVRVLLTFRHRPLRPGEPTSALRCVFWSPVDRRWSGQGCRRLSSNRDATRCRCTHLTSFALLLDHSGALDEALDGPHAAAQRWLSVAGGAASTLLLAYAAAAFAALARRRAWHFVDLHLCLSLLAAQLLFAGAAGAGLDRGQWPRLCPAVALLLHFLFLCVFAWTANEGARMYLKLVRVLPAAPPVGPGTQRRLMFAVGYGLPLLLTAAGAAAAFDDYGTERGCWLAPRSIPMWLFVGPVLAAMAGNGVVLGLALCRIRYGSHVGRHQRRRRRRGLLGVTKVFFLMALLGLTWLSGLPMVGDAALVFSYIFLVANLSTSLLLCLGYRLFALEARVALLQSLARLGLLPRAARAFVARHGHARAAKGSQSGAPTFGSGSGARTGTVATSGSTSERPGARRPTRSSTTASAAAAELRM